MITTEERKYLIVNMKYLLETYLYDYTDAALDSIIDEWADKKGGLIEAFKKHPNYQPGKFMIAFDFDCERSIDMKEVLEFSSWIRSIKRERREYLPKEILDRTKPYEDLAESIERFLLSLNRYADRCLSDRTAKKLDEIIPEIHPHSGEKTSRVVNRICHYLKYDEADGYNKAFASYSDALSPKTIKRHLILSINPLDYLTMSFGNSWASCHTIDKTNIRDMPNSYSGAYSSGTMSYMFDKVSMVMYTVDISYEGTEYWDQPKINRQMFHYGEEKLVQGRLYPQDNDGLNSFYTPYRNIAQNIVSTIFEFPNSWILKRGVKHIDSFTDTDGTHYADYLNFNSCNISILKGSENKELVEIGSYPICPVCGEYHLAQNNISCCGGGGVYYCADCGDEIDIEDAYEINGKYYCGDCVSECDHCGCYHHNLEYVRSIDGYVCSDCLENYFTECEYCGRYHLTRNMECHNGSYVCDDCYERIIEEDDE